MHILLAEDNPVNQKVALRMLDRMGYTADVANNGIEAIEALEQRKYDIILMDMQMPEMDGLEATRRIVAAYPEGRRPHIIALTANAMQGDRERCIEAGMNDYISKPIRIEDLKQAFERCPASEAEEQTEAENDAGAEIIDVKILEELIEMLGNDIEFASGLIRDFLEDGRELLGSIRSAREIGDAQELERAAHTLKSSSATFGALDVSDVCKELEEQASQGQISGDVGSKIERLEELFKAVSSALEAYISKQMA